MQELQLKHLKKQLTAKIFYFWAKRPFFLKKWRHHPKNVIALNMYIGTNVLVYERWLVLKARYRCLTCLVTSSLPMFDICLEKYSLHMFDRCLETYSLHMFDICLETFSLYMFDICLETSSLHMFDIWFIDVHSQKEHLQGVIEEDNHQGHCH